MNDEPDLGADRGSCDSAGRHVHRWKRDVDGKEQLAEVHVGPSGVVILSEGVVEQLLVDAGWEQRPSPARDFGRGCPPGRVPIQDEDRQARRGPKPQGHVSWEEHLEAWTEYHRHHDQQDADTIARRGGFGYWEITDLLGREPTTWEPR